MACRRSKIPTLARASDTTNTSTGGNVRVADTSFLYALFSHGDSMHARAVREAGRIDSLLIPGEILSETLALIHYRQGFDAARSAGEWIRAQSIVEIGLATPGTLDGAWHEFQAARGRLSYPDAVVVSWCRAQSARPLSFDTHLLAHLRS